MEKRIVIAFLISLAIVLSVKLETTEAQSSTNINLTDSLLTNDTIPFERIINVRTHWSYEHPEQIQFNFTVPDEPLFMTYTLDNQANIPVSGNFTLTNLTYGKHNVTLFVTDSNGNTIYHMYHAELPEEGIIPVFPSFDTNLLLVVILTMPSIIAGFLIVTRYRKKTN